MGKHDRLVGIMHIFNAEFLSGFVFVCNGSYHNIHKKL